MLIRAVIRHEIHYYFELEPLGLGYQPVEIGQSFITRTDVRNVGNVAEVDLRAPVNQRQPNGLSAYAYDMF
ncbi:hypothetical protein QLX08_001537 [Tetragonisca angustula]|uniref:Uncharacterized protein n=1 Tax=Tetragonisca angustula TaxID=166442 RepID=A0AAW1AF52_9HYME